MLVRVGRTQMPLWKARFCMIEPSLIDHWKASRSWEYPVKRPARRRCDWACHGEPMVRRGLNSPLRGMRATARATGAQAHRRTRRAHGRACGVLRGRADVAERWPPAARGYAARVSPHKVKSPDAGRRRSADKGDDQD